MLALVGWDHLVEEGVLPHCITQPSAAVNGSTGSMQSLPVYANELQKPHSTLHAGF